MDCFNLYEGFTTSNTVDLPKLTDGVWVGGGGHVAAVMQNGNVALFDNVPPGTLLPIRVKRVNSTGSTATALVALYQR